MELTIDDAILLAADLMNAKQFKDTENLCRGILEIDPNHVNAMHLLGVALTEQNQLYEAIYRFDRVLRLRKRWPMALSNYGMVLGELGHHEEALVQIRKAAHLEPSNYLTWNNLGNTLERLGRFDESVKAFDECIRLKPDHELSWSNKATVLIRQGKIDDALHCISRCLEINPDNADAHYNRGCVLLAAGEFKEGFREYEWRKRTVDIIRPLYGPFPHPSWDGSSLDGKTLLVHAEQGIGDAIQFLRYIPLIKGGKIYLAVHEPIRSLVEFDGVEILVPGSKWPEFDYQCHLITLAHIFETTPETIPDPWVPDVSTAIIPSGYNVGVCWSGNWKHKNDKHRSISLAKFSQILTAPNVNFYSLQKEIRRMDIDDWSTSINEFDLSDFKSTAASIKALDLVISVDTSVAHMAATLGIPTWVLVPAFNTDWRWGLNKDDSPWYPSIRIFRQNNIGDWDGVLNRVRNEIRLVSAAKAA